jgi:general secretion pathway protein D
MNNWPIMMIVLSLSLLTASVQAQVPSSPSPQYLVAQNDFFDEEEDLEDPINDADLDEVEPGDVAEPDAPPSMRSRFRNRRNRFRNQNNNTGSSSTGSASLNNNKPSTPVKELKVKKVDASSKKKKISFAEAQPEDITDENFPDIIESFNYPNANIMDVANAIGKLTKKNFIMEPGLNGKITIVAPTPVTVAQAWKMFLTALAMNSYTIVPTGDGYLKIRKEGNAKNDSIETYSGAYYPTSDQLITRIVNLKYIQAESLKKSLEKFVSKKAGNVEAYENTNSIIISGYGSSVERISRIIEELDKPGFEERLEVIPIRHAKAKDIAELIEKIIKDGEDDQKGSRFRRSRFSKGGEGKTENLKLVAPDDRTNSIIVVGNKQGIDRIRKLVGRLDYPLDPADAGGVYVYYVKHGEAVKIAETLSGIAEESEKAVQDANKGAKDDKTFQAPKIQKPIFGGNVVIKADENTNSLIVTASKQDYKVVKNLLAKIDIAKDQVFVEAIIMEMEANNTNNWNMNYMKFFPNPEGANGATATNGEGIARAGFSGGSINSLIDPTSGKGAILNLGDPSETVTLNLGGQTIEVPSLLALINILKERVNANILSTPNILAMDNEESEIEVGDEVPVGNQQTAFGQGQLTVAPQFRDATILLKIKPFISPDSDIVRLNVEQKIQKVSSKIIRAENLANNTQSLTKKSLKTNIVLESGQTAVLGGLMEDEDSITESKVPLLGDIPVLGWLFKNSTVAKVKKNLVIFLTPKIIRNSQAHQEILQQKMSERIDWIKQNSGGVDPYGERFNNLIQDASASAKTFVPRSDEIELDLEEAIPLGDDPEGDESETTDLLQDLENESSEEI